MESLVVLTLAGFVFWISGLVTCFINRVKQYIPYGFYILGSICCGLGAFLASYLILTVLFLVLFLVSTFMFCVQFSQSTQNAST